MTTPAVLSTERGATMEAVVMVSHGRRWWKCPACGRTLAEIVENRVVVKVGSRYVVIFLHNDQMQRCPHPASGASSVLRKGQVAA